MAALATLKLGQYIYVFFSFANLIGFREEVIRIDLDQKGGIHMIRSMFFV